MARLHQRKGAMDASIVRGDASGNRKSAAAGRPTRAPSVRRERRSAACVEGHAFAFETEALAE
jgi:hypothetical protein